MTGIWPAHTNVEKYIMGLRDKFPVEVGKPEIQINRTIDE